VIVREVIPDIAVGGIVLADGAPLPLGKVRAPAFPVFGSLGVLVEAMDFGGLGQRIGHAGDCSRDRRFNWMAQKNGSERGPSSPRAGGQANPSFATFSGARGPPARWCTRGSRRRSGCSRRRGK